MPSLCSISERIRDKKEVLEETWFSESVLRRGGRSYGRGSSESDCLGFGNKCNLLLLFFIIITVCLSVCLLCVWMPAPIPWRPDGDTGCPLSFSVYSFEAGSLPWPGSGILSARLETSKPHHPPVSTSTLELGLQVCLGHQAYNWVVSI